MTEELPQRPTNHGESKPADGDCAAGNRRRRPQPASLFAIPTAAGLAGSTAQDHEPETHLIPNVLKVALGQAEADAGVRARDCTMPDGTYPRLHPPLWTHARAHILALEQ